MSYSTAHCPAGESTSTAENHFKVLIDVYLIDGSFVKRIIRTVMSDEEGKRTIRYNKKMYQIKSMKEMPDGTLKLKIMSV
jgi:hypothetical protein